MTARALAVVAVAVLALAACGDRSDPDAAATFDGDADSPFCEASRAAADSPVLDPFEPDLPPDRVERRFRALADRFHRFATVAPAELEDDLELLDGSLGELAETLEDAEFDFERLATSELDLTIFDDPAFTEVAERLTAYQRQVCGI